MLMLMLINNALRFMDNILPMFIVQKKSMMQLLLINNILALIYIHRSAFNHVRSLPSSFLPSCIQLHPLPPRHSSWLARLPPTP